MRKQMRRIAAGLAATSGIILTGCSGTSGGSKPNAQIREVDVATNVVDTITNVDTAAVLVNGGGSDVAVPYGLASRYLFVQAGNIGFQGSTSMTLPTLTQILAGATTPSTTTVPPPISVVNLATGGFYTGYLVGRPDVPNPVQIDLSDLDPRFLKVVVLQDNQVVPAAGQATVRVMNGACDAGNVDVLINGTTIPAFTNIPYSTQAAATTVDQSVAAGTVSVSVNFDGAVATTSKASRVKAQVLGVTQLVAPTPVTLVAGNRYTLVVNEPTAITQPGVVPPVPPATATTFGVVLVTDN